MTDSLLDIPKVVVLGTGRSGSGFLAKMLTAAGVPCGHERYYSFTEAMPHDVWPVESSWLALPYVERMARFGEGVPALLWQHRNPLDVLNSKLNGDYRPYMEHDKTNPYFAFMVRWGAESEDAAPAEWMLRSDDAPKVIRWFARWITDWCARIERLLDVQQALYHSPRGEQVTRWSVDDLRQPMTRGDVACRIARLLGKDADRLSRFHEKAATWQPQDNDFNRHRAGNRKGPGLTWESLADVLTDWEYAEFQLLAERLGYRVDTDFSTC